MIVLLDTNAFIWWVADDKYLGPKARAVIANPANNVYISNLSVFECSIKAKPGRLKIDFSVVDQEISERKLLELRFDTLAARQLVDQPNLPQSDPFNAAIDHHNKRLSYFRIRTFPVVSATWAPLGRGV